MTSSATMTGATNACAMAYEALRTHVLTGTTAGSPAGLVLLLRQGVAAWMVRRSAGVASPAVASLTPIATRLAGDETQVTLVRVLASMALAGQQKVRI